MVTTTGSSTAFTRSCPQLQAPSRLATRPPLRLADQLLEARLVADRVEVGVAGGVLAEPLRPFDGRAEVLHGVGLVARQALAAGEVVVQQRRVGLRLEQLPAPRHELGVVAGLVQAPQRRPDLPARVVVRLARGAAERQD